MGLRKIIAAATLPVAAVAALLTAAPSHAGATGTKGLVGYTVFGGNYSSGQSRLQSIAQFDSYWGTDSVTGQPRTPAHNVQKVYFGSRQFQTSGNNPQPLSDLAGAGIKMLISVKPSQDIAANGPADKQKLAAMIAWLKSIGANFEITLWQEWNNNYFPSAAAYRSYVQYYGPTVTSAGITLVYDPIAWSGSSSSTVVTGFPGTTYTDSTGTHPLCTKIAGDYYADQWMNHHYLDGMPSEGGGTGLGTGGLAALADRVGVPFGLWEYGMTDNGKVIPTQTQYYQFLGYIGKLFAARLAAGKANADILGYTNPGPASSDQVSGADDWKLPAYQELYDTLNG